VSVYELFEHPLYYIINLQMYGTLYLYMHANEQTRYVDYAFNSSYIKWKQNKTYITYTVQKIKHTS